MVYQFWAPEKTLKQNLINSHLVGHDITLDRIIQSVRLSWSGTIGQFYTQNNRDILP